MIFFSPRIKNHEIHKKFMRFYQYFSTVLIGCLLLYACQTIKPFEREKQLYLYLNKVQNIDANELQTIDYVFVVQTGRCQSCVDEVKVFLKSKFSKSSSKKLFILGAKSNKDFYASFNNAIVKVDYEFNMERYGLVFADDLLVEQSQGQLHFWSFLNHLALPSLEKKYPSKDN